MSTSHDPREDSAAAGAPAASGPATAAPHPLDPLTAEEIRQVASVLRRDRAVGPRWRFASIELAEPAKDGREDQDTERGSGARQQHPGQSAADRERPSPEPAGRAAVAVCWNRDDGQAYRAAVSLTDDAVTAWEHLPGQQPNMTLDEWHECDEMLRAHPQLAAALSRRGLTDPARVLTDVWAYGAALVPPRYRGLRLGWSDVWYRGSADGNPYAHHVSGLHPIVDLNQMTLLEIEDNLDSGAADSPPEVMGEYAPRLLPMPLREVAPLEISQPEGVSFTLDGRLLCWQNWQLRAGFNYREGLVLHEVGFRDAGRLRSVAHRLSFAEMVVPYRDPTSDHYRRTAFDIGEWGLGFMTDSLEHGCDCLGEISYLDAVVHDSAAAAGYPPRDLHPRGGQRDRLEARRSRDRRRSPAGPAARGVVPGHGGELRVSRVLAVLPGRQHRVRGARHRHPGHLVFPGPAPAAVRNAGGPADLRAVPPAFHRCAP